ncbi:LOW QUALITY PROTEIN: transport and Golgi organization protein 6 homolog [Rhinatrema bivittatum]|uniref:LOW QUALITY PROTEIN: transport and Golgi organization protein 6 homolog n=1 Tax=Rhinatrema bivittatum TaxID=194408 RepID=UPI0011267BC5|nr:LOW QUALITY PROTEIN: transport and Golgi organization protein 6 homolog [Rhinatrema bivittatum]
MLICIGHAFPVTFDWLLSMCHHSATAGWARGKEKEKGPSLQHAKKQAILLETFKSNLLSLEKKFEHASEWKELWSLRERVAKGTKWLESSPDVTWKFTSETLLLLLCLRQCMVQLVASFQPTKPNLRTAEAAPALSPDTLSVSQQKTFQSALEFVVTLGICPYLLPGVGIPLRRRSEFGAVVEDAVSCDSCDTARRLFISCTILLDISQHPSLGNLLLTRHLGDIMAGLCQLGFCPSRTKADQRLEEGLLVLTEGERAQCREALHGLLDRVYQPLVIRELLVLQGASKQGSQPHAAPCSKHLVHAPAWLRRLCGQLLSERLMRPNGVQAVLRGILEGAGAGDAAADWRTCSVVGKILACCPQQSLSLDSYYQLVCPQILDLLHMMDNMTARHFQQVASVTVLAMAQEKPALALKYLLYPLLEPLLRCLDMPGKAEAEPQPGTVLVEESELVCCIEDIQKVYVVGNELLPVLQESLKTVLGAIFSLYCFTKQNVSYLRSPCQEILLWFLEKMDRTSAVAAVKELAGLERATPALHPLCQFAAGSGGGTMIMVKEAISDEEELLFQKVSADQWQLECLVDLLSQNQKSGLAGDFFLCCLKDLTAVAVEEQLHPDSISRDILQQLERSHEQQLREQEKRLLTLQLVAVLCEKVSGSMFTDLLQVVEFVGTTLKRALVSLTQNEESSVDAQTLSMAMGLVAAMLGGAVQLKSEDFAMMKQLMPLLEQISSSHPDPVIQELASDLCITIATHGAIPAGTLGRGDTWSHSRKQEINGCVTGMQMTSWHRGRPAGHEEKLVSASTEQPQSEKRAVNPSSSTKKKSVPKEDPLYSSGPGNLCRGQQPCIHELQGGATSAYTSKELLEVLESAYDPSVPLRASALRTIASLIEQRDCHCPETPRKRCSSLEQKRIFLENLEHEDSFVYLSAVQGVALLSDVYPEQILPILLAQYGNIQRAPESRMKMGEVLMRVTRALGDMVFCYRDPLIHAFLRGTRDHDSTLRASSLANLGEVCQRLQFTLGSLVHEMTSCLTAVVKTDCEAEVRRAGVHVVVLLFRGLSEKTTEVLRDVLKDLYHLLKFVVQSEHDEAALLHAQLALQELDEIIRCFLFPQQKLEKKIVVLP